jgi:hypothetical protein
MKEINKRFSQNKKIMSPPKGVSSSRSTFLSKKASIEMKVGREEEEENEGEHGLEEEEEEGEEEEEDISKT